MGSRLSRSVFTVAFGLMTLPSTKASTEKSVAPEEATAVAAMNPAQRKLYQALSQMAPSQRPATSLSFAPDTPPEIVNAFLRLLWPGADQEFAQVRRWPGGGQGDPRALTYSFVPDGVSVPGILPLDPGAPNELFATFNGIFGTPADWQPFWAESFARWAQLAGLTYQQVPDDGAPLFGSDGSASRGDVRISARPLDGPGGILAFNNFPQADLLTPGGGDMVLDSLDTQLWGDPDGDFLLLRNTILHEHGHGLGFLHVCPVNETKLMEPFISSQFNGPQEDDVRGAQRHYGDSQEPNDSAGQATSLGAVQGFQWITAVSLDDGDDVDVYSVFVPAGSMVAALVVPVGTTYSNSGQVLFNLCLNQQDIAAAQISDLSLTQRNTDGVTPLRSANNGGLGAFEVLFPEAVGAAGTYFFEVNGSAIEDVQLYGLLVFVGTSEAVQQQLGQGKRAILRSLLDSQGQTPPVPRDRNLSKLRR